MSSVRQSETLPVITTTYNEDLNLTQPARTPRSPWGSRTVSFLKSSCSAVVNSTESLAQSVFYGLGELTAVTSKVAAVFRKLQKHSLAMVEQLTGSNGKYKALNELLRRYVCFADFMQVPADVCYFATAAWKERNSDYEREYKPADSKAIIGAHVAMAVANAGGALLWLESMGFFDLSKAAAKLGNTKVFGFVPKIVSTLPIVGSISVVQKIAHAFGELRVFGLLARVSLLSVVLRAADLMWAFFAVDAAQRLVAADTSHKKISAGLDLASFSSELVISAVLLAGVTNIVALGVLGGVCISTTLASFLYSVSHDRELKPVMPHNLNPVAVNA